MNPQQIRITQWIKIHPNHPPDVQISSIILEGFLTHFRCLQVLSWYAVSKPDTDMQTFYAYTHLATRVKRQKRRRKVNSLNRVDVLIYIFFHFLKMKAVSYSVTCDYYSADFWLAQSAEYSLYLAPYYAIGDLNHHFGFLISVHLSINATPPGASLEATDGRKPGLRGRVRYELSNSIRIKLTPWKH